MNKPQLALLGLIVIAIGSYFLFDLDQYLTLDFIQSQLAEVQAYKNDNFATAAAIYFFGYVLVTALSIPGAILITLMGGAIFGVVWGTLLVSFASSIGATGAFLASRLLLRDWVQSRFGDYLAPINKGMEKDGTFYLFSIRMVPVFPYFMVNLLMGLTPIKTSSYYLASQAGMFASTIVFVNAGSELAQITSLSGLVSGSLLFSFVLLGALPLLAKFGLGIVQRNQVMKGYVKPKKFDANVVVVGAGSAGLVAALIVAGAKAKVVLIEQHKMGGDCLNTGCVPSKAMIRSARLASDMKRGVSLGFKEMQPDFDFADVMERVQRVIRKIEPHDSVERFESLGVNVEIGEAEILSPYTVRVNGQVLSTRNIIVATGAEPFIPPIKGIERIKFLTSDNLWELRELPRRLVVLGGGPIGTELTQTFNRLGCEVTQVEREPQIMTREDPEIAEMVAATSRAEGVTVLTGYTATEVVIDNGEKFLICAGDEERKIPFDELLVAVGRKANSSGFGLENLNVEITDRGTIAVDEYLRTNYPNIYAIGDVAGPYQFTHTAAHMAWYATVNALFGTFRKFKVDYSVVPWSTFCSPEVARVGINEKEAKVQNIDYEVTQFDVAELDRAIADELDHGVVKVLTVPGKDTILGVTIAADHAGDLISEYVLAMKHGLGLNKILGTIHIYPTLAEMNKFVAGEWRKNHKPEWALNLAEKYHSWRRGNPAVKKVGSESKPSQA